MKLHACPRLVSRLVSRLVMFAAVPASDYREVGGLRVPHRFVETNEHSGHTIYEVERVEIGVELNPGFFTLQR
jgi:hypothetical protein